MESNINPEQEILKKDAVGKSSPKEDCLDEKLNVIVADTDWETFEILSPLQKTFNILNLSSEFAVCFILEYEKVDVLFISSKIVNLEHIQKLCLKKKTRLYILGIDADYPPVLDEITNILKKEKSLKTGQDSGKHKKISALFSNFFKNQNDAKIKNNRNDFKDTCEDDKGSNMPVSEKYSPEEKNNPGARKKEAPDDCSDNKVISEVDRRSQTGLVAVKQKIIVFIKAKGGVGSTVLSLYLSFKFSRLRTLLVDLNFSEGGGDTGYYLDLPKIPNMVFFTEGYSRASLDNSIINIDDNFDILQPPPTYDLSKKIDLQDLYSLIDIARKKYHLVIFDLPNHIDDLYLGTIDMADLAVLVSDSTAGSIGRLSDINERFIYPDLEKILVLNRNSNGNGQQMASESFNLKNGLQDFICLKESEILKGRSDFKKFNFGLIREFDELERKVMAKLLMD